MEGSIERFVSSVCGVGVIAGAISSTIVFGTPASVIIGAIGGGIGSVVGLFIMRWLTQGQE
jgi:uncharacterized membrane protein